MKTIHGIKKDKSHVLDDYSTIQYYIVLYYILNLKICLEYTF
jgi:hypothetical protein